MWNVFQCLRLVARIIGEVVNGVNFTHKNINYTFLVFGQISPIFYFILFLHGLILQSPRQSDKQSTRDQVARLSPAGLFCVAKCANRATIFRGIHTPNKTTK